MRRIRLISRIALAVALVATLGERLEAQIHHVSIPGVSSVPYGYGINNGQIAPGYQAAYRFSPRVNPQPLAGQRQTVTDYQPLINAITSLPGWSGPAARPSRPVAPQPTVARSELIGDDGKVLWPTAAPNDPGVAPARRAAEEAVRAAVREQRDAGQATIRHVADARNKLDAFAYHALPALKAKNASDAAGLERFIVELKKTLATMAVHY